MKEVEETGEADRQAGQAGNMEQAEDTEQVAEMGERDEDEDEGDDGSVVARSKSGRRVQKSRVILEEKEYQKDVADANNLIYVRRGLKHSWKIFEENNPPSYVSSSLLYCTVPD